MKGQLGQRCITNTILIEIHNTFRGHYHSSIKDVLFSFKARVTAYKCLAMSFFISAMALPGLRPFGQVLVQFMIV